MKTIDINCDVGEGIGNERLLMPYLSSCNIACAGHAGSVETIDETILLAKLNKVKIGAHPSFPDKENFGRKLMHLPADVLQKSLEDQIRLLKKRADLHGVELNHVKAHGALYNAAAKDEKIANILINAVKNSVKNVVFYAPYNSVLAQLSSKNGFDVKYEAFIDRNYNDDLTLVSRDRKNAVIIDKTKAFEHLKKMILSQKVKTINNLEVTILADTYCVHGDNKNAKDLLIYISKRLDELDIKIDK